MRRGLIRRYHHHSYHRLRQRRRASTRIPPSGTGLVRIPVSPCTAGEVEVRTDGQAVNQDRNYVPKDHRA